jgi:pilus assembly protein FimV
MPATKVKLFGVVLLLAVFNSHSMTLGRMRGAALVGQGLDVAIQVQADPDETPSSQCFEADVFHGDTRQDPSRVQLVVEPTQTAQTFNVRISSSAVVDEPVVTVYLRSLCSQKTSRRYVLLADVASDQLAPVAPRVVQIPFVTPANASASASSDVAASTASAPNVALQPVLKAPR